MKAARRVNRPRVTRIPATSSITPAATSIGGSGPGSGKCEEFLRRMLKEQKACENAKKREQLRLPARKPSEFHEERSKNNLYARLSAPFRGRQQDQACSRCFSRCAPSSASSWRERWIISTQSWNACASPLTISFSGPS